MWKTLLLTFMKITTLQGFVGNIIFLAATNKNMRPLNFDEENECWQTESL